MNRRDLIRTLLFTSAALATGPAGAVTPLPKVQFALVGDSTVAKQQGWGNAFLAQLTGGATGTNFGHNGTSTKSFRDLGDWNRVLESHPTHILIQFGHNDMPGKGPERETDPATTYRENLSRYIDEARMAGATPILVTSLVRRTWENGKLKDLLIPYADAARAVAKEKNVPLVDLHERSRELIERLGPEGGTEFCPLDKEGKLDRTHLTKKGGEVFAALVIEELKKVVPTLTPFFRPEVTQ